MPKMPDVYTAEMGNPPVEQDAGILARGKRPMPAPAGAARRRPAPMPTRPNPADANIFTADKGIQPPSPDEGPTMNRRRPGMKKGGCVKKAAGGKVGSASKRADGIATKGKTKGRMI